MACKRRSFSASACLPAIIFLSSDKLCIARRSTARIIQVEHLRGSLSRPPRQPSRHGGLLYVAQLTANLRCYGAAVQPFKDPFHHETTRYAGRSPTPRLLHRVGELRLRIAYNLHLEAGKMFISCVLRRFIHLRRRDPRLVGTYCVGFVLKYLFIAHDSFPFLANYKCFVRYLGLTT